MYRVVLISASLRVFSFCDYRFAPSYYLADDCFSLFLIATIFFVLFFSFGPFGYDLDHTTLVLHLILNELVSVKEVLDAASLHKKNNGEDNSKNIPNVAKPKWNSHTK